jgi:hypothetical protein
MLQGNVISIKTAKVNKEVTLRRKIFSGGAKSSRAKMLQLSRNWKLFAAVSEEEAAS